MGLKDFFMKINMAGGGAAGSNPTQALFAGIESLGLKVVSQQGAVVDFEGAYAGREAGMHVDGGNVTKAGNMAMAGGIASELIGSLGGSGQTWTARRVYYRSRNLVQHATMMLEWRVKAMKNIPDGLSVGKEAQIGPSIGSGLFASEAKPALQTPDMLSSFTAAKFHEITVKDGAIQAFWAPPMTEYQKIAASPDSFTATSRAVLDLLVKLDDALDGA
jgi:hypothetical protein